MIGTIGVLIPTHNRVALLRTTVHSALAQTYRNLELLIMDDRSEDETSNYGSSLADDRVQYVRNEENLGLARNIDKGVDLFSGRVAWCTVLCDDDFLDPRFLEAATRDIQAFQARSIVLGRTRFVDRDGRFLRESSTVPAEEDALEYLKFRSRFLRDRYLSGVVFSRKHYWEIGGYPRFQTGMAADDALVFALGLRDRIVHSRDAVACVRIHPEAESLDVRNIRKHLVSLGQYGEYCMKKFSDISGSRPEDRRRVGYYLRRQITGMDSRIWLEAVHRALGPGEDGSGKETPENLLALASGGEFPFTARVRWTIRIFRSTGIWPEKYRSYEKFWRRVDRLSRAVERLLLEP